MSSPGDFAKMVPGFDFLQGLMKNAGSALPGMGQWIAPSLDPAELDKRIEELRTVQFWLEQNARMLSTTIQALEVQRMTLSTLKSMNVPVADLAEAFKIKTPAAAARTASRKAAPTAKAAATASESGGGAAAGGADPMQWWGALTRQFTDLAARTLRETGTEAPKSTPPAPAAEAAAASRAGTAPAPKPVRNARRTPAARKSSPRKG